MTVQENLSTLPDTEAVQELLRQARAGDVNAIQELFVQNRDCFLPPIRRLLRQPLRTRFDSDDFLQDTFLYLMKQHLPDGALVSRATFVAYVGKIGINIVYETYKKHVVQVGRSLKREVSLERYLLARGGDVPVGKPADTGPYDRELWELFLYQLPVVYAQVLSLRYAGRTQVQVAEQTGISERYVRAIVVRCQDRFQRFREHGTDPLP